MNPKITESIYPRISEITALLLWELGAIRVDLENPFKLVSGNYSPIYINCRLVISDPTFMRLFTSFAGLICKRSEIRVDVVAGGETAGIPFAAYVAQVLSLPLVYVRKKSKEHGIASQVEGIIQKGERVLLVEDLITDAGSKLNFINAIRASNGVVEDTLVLFDRFQGGKEALEEEGVRLHSMTDMQTSLGVAKEAEFLTDKKLLSIREYLQNPRKWHNRHNPKYLEV